MAMKKKTGAPRGRERRGSERADARLSMRVESAAVSGSGKIVTESQNISSSGVYCHASHYLAPLSKVQLTIVLPAVPMGRDAGARKAAAQELVKCDGIVVRCDQGSDTRSETPYELACMFTGLDASLKQRIEEFVTWRNLQALRAALAAPVAASKKKTAARRAAPARTAKKTAKRAAKPAAGRRTSAGARSKPARRAKPAAKRTARGGR